MFYCADHCQHIFTYLLTYSLEIEASGRRSPTIGSLKLKQFLITSSITVSCLPQESYHTHKRVEYFIQWTYGTLRWCVCVWVYVCAFVLMDLEFYLFLTYLNELSVCSVSVDRGILKRIWSYSVNVPWGSNTKPCQIRWDRESYDNKALALKSLAHPSNALSASVCVHALPLKARSIATSSPFQMGFFCDYITGISYGKGNQLSFICWCFMWCVSQ